MPTYYAETGIGATLVRARDIEAARRAVLRDVGTYNGVQRIRVATKEDKAWVQAMSGAVNE